MITETGRVVAIESDSLWVETIQRSTCNSCVAEKGCGQRVLQQWGAHTSYLRVLLEGRNADAYQVDDEVSIGVPEDVVVKGSLFVYLLPLVMMLVGAYLGHKAFAGSGDGPSVIAAFLGLLIGGLLVRWRAWQTRNDERVQPVLMDGETKVNIMSHYVSEK